MAEDDADNDLPEGEPAKGSPAGEETAEAPTAEKASVEAREPERVVGWRRALRPKAWMRSTQAIVGCLLFFMVAGLVATQVPLPPRLRDVLLGGPTLVAAVVWMRRMRLSWATIAVISTSLILYGVYVGYTAFAERNFDGPEQWNYVKHVATTGTLPDKDTCFVCHHPPAYYVLAAGMYRGATALGVAKVAKVVQGFSIPLAFAFVMFGVLTVRRFTERSSLVTLAAALLAFWPYTVIQSARIHNDVLLSTAAAGSLYFAVRWVQEDRRLDLGLSAALALLAVFTKLNGLVVVATLAVVAAVHTWRATDRKAAMRRAAPFVLVLVSAAGAFALLRGSGTGMGERSLGTAYDVRVYDYVGNEPVNYVYFDLETFLSEPYVMARLDGTGRQYFWNHLLTSSLFSTHNLQPDVETSYRFNRRLASVMCIVLLMMVALVVAGLVRLRSGPRGRVLPVGVFVWFTLAAHIAFKVAVPFAHHNDFRFSYPVLIPFVLAVVLGLEQLEEQGLVFARIGRWGGWLFVALSMVYHVPKYEFVVAHLPRKVLRMSQVELKPRLFGGASWENENNHVFFGDEQVEMGLLHAKDVGRIEIGLDAGNVYRIEIVGEELRTFELSPKATKKVKGNVIHRLPIEPPVKKVHTIRVIPVSGDRTFSVSYLRLNRDAKPPTKRRRSKKKQPKKAPRKRPSK